VFARYYIETPEIIAVNAAIARDRREVRHMRSLKLETAVKTARTHSELRAVFGSLLGLA